MIPDPRTASGAAEVDKIIREHVDQASQRRAAEEREAAAKGTSASNGAAAADPDKEAAVRDAALRLARLTPAGYDLVREKEAEQLGIRMGTLDKYVDTQRSLFAELDGKATGGKPVEFKDPDPWPDPVDGAELLKELCQTARRYVIASNDVYVANALWIVFSYSYDLGDVCPNLLIDAPAMRAGKTRLLTFVAKTARRPCTVSSGSGAFVYRIIEQHSPTLLFDEVDRFLPNDDGKLLGLINAGHTRSTAYYGCCDKVGDEIVPVRWSTWAPKVFAGINSKSIAATLTDRSITVVLARKKKSEKIDRLRERTRFDDLRKRISRWVADHSHQIRAADPAIPDQLNDRAADNWSPLLAIADLCGPQWPATARRAAIRLSGSDTTEAEGVGIELLADIRKIFTEGERQEIGSQELADALANLPESRWAAYGKRGDRITPVQIARGLAPFGIKSRTIRVNAETKKGYPIQEFADAWERYL